MGYAERDNSRIYAVQGISSLLEKDPEGLLEEGENKFRKAQNLLDNDRYEVLAETADVFLDQSEADYSIEKEFDGSYWEAAGFVSKEELRNHLRDLQASPTWTRSYTSEPSDLGFFETQRGPV